MKEGASININTLLLPMHLWDDYIQMQKQALYCLHDDICQCIHLKCAIYSPRTLGRATVDNASRETTALRANIALTLCVHATIAKLYKSSLELEWFREHVMSTWDEAIRMLNLAGKCLLALRNEVNNPKSACLLTAWVREPAGPRCASVRRI